MKKTLLASALAGVLMLGACTETNKTTASAPMTDSQLEAEIKRQLDAEPI